LSHPQGDKWGQVAETSPKHFEGDSPPPTAQIFSCFSIYFFKNTGIWEINTYIWGNFENFVPKNPRATYMSNFSSKKKEMANKVLTLKISKISLGCIATF